MVQHTRFFRDAIEKDPTLLHHIRRGVEKESLRVNIGSATIAQTPHPKALGSSLTHRSITTDYSEALLEFITPVSESVAACEYALDNLHRFTAQQLEGELLWNASMPCIVSGDSGIPIAHFGISNVGMMKRIYRNGLGVRYGRRMQAIAGIHYNFSLPERFWDTAWHSAGKPGTRANFQTEGYLALIRNFFSRVWLLIYLLGASPAVCASFLQGKKDHALLPMGADHHSYFLPHATSLRMGDLGYTSNAQASLAVRYNSLDQYISTLREAIMIPHLPYRDFPPTDSGELPQLNDSLLQIENEYYSPIRPKRVTRSGQAPVVALADAGIEYVEVRCVDLNPFLPLGIDVATMRLLDLFLLSCLIDKSPLCDDQRLFRDRTNLMRIVNKGRQPGLTLLSEEGDETSLSELAASTLGSMDETAKWLDNSQRLPLYRQVIDQAKACIEDPSKTPSARLLQEIEQSGQSFWELALAYSKKWHKRHVNAVIPQKNLREMHLEATDSLRRQKEIENLDTISFEEYLRSFYRQY